MARKRCEIKRIEMQKMIKVFSAQVAEQSISKRKLLKKKKEKEKE